MTKTSKTSINNFIEKINWKESYASLILGAIIVVVLGMLLANYLSGRKKGKIETGEETARTEIMPNGNHQYKVVTQDSLSAISQKHYGTMDFWPTLAKINKIANPNVIFVDSTLEIPPKEEIEKMQELTTSTAYQVQEGDTLFTIAEKVYGDGSKWPVLHRSNGSLRLPNSNPLVFAGSTIVVPR